MKNSALAVIDLQNDITKNYREIMDKVNEAIDWAIRHGLDRVEAGAQGDHKLARGYMPTVTHSLHWLTDPGLARAVQQFLIAEAAAVDEEIDVLTEYGPFRKTDMEEQQ